MRIYPTSDAYKLYVLRISSCVCRAVLPFQLFSRELRLPLLSFIHIQGLLFRKFLTILRIADSIYTEFPPFDNQDKASTEKHDSPFEFTFEDRFEKYQTQSEMAGSGSPYIKSEPNDLFSNPHQFAPNQQHNGFNIGSHQSQFGMSANGGNIDPSQLMGGNSFQNFGSQNMSSSFVMGNSGIADDELLDLGNLDDVHGQGNYGQGQQGFDASNGMNHQPNYFNSNNASNGIPMSMGNMSNVYSSTPDGAPIQSPFVNNNFNYNQFRPMNSQQQPQQQAFSVPTSAGFVHVNSRAQHMQNMERKISDSRSPATPNTPGLQNLHLGEPEFPHPGFQHINHHRHSASMSNNWDSTPSGQSWNESSPFPSPANGHMQHAQINEVLRSNGKMAASLPADTKLMNGGSLQSQEAKKKRRRESHNQVERRRRDNINERIQDLAHLVPQHRLEDEKVRKHLQTNSPLSPSITATGMSPPQATSLLAGGTGRRATTAGTITQGLPADDKDKGPNKGDILNGSVAWTRDLLWLLSLKLDQEAQLEDKLNQLGQPWPFERSDEEKRMRSEVFEVTERHRPSGGLSRYSRAHGTGLRVPHFTNVAGEPVSSDPGMAGYNAQSLSPGFQSGGSGMSSGQQQPQFWSTSQANFKEEDEYDMMT